MLFCHVLKMTAIFIFIAYTISVQYEMQEKITLDAESSRASNNACPLGTKSGRRLAALPNRLRRQWPQKSKFVVVF